MASQNLGLRTTPWSWPRAEVWLLAAVQVENSLAKIAEVIRVPPSPREEGFEVGCCLPADGKRDRAPPGSGPQATERLASQSPELARWGEGGAGACPGLEPSCPTSHMSQSGGGGGQGAELANPSGTWAAGERGQEGGSDQDIQTQASLRGEAEWAGAEVSLPSGSRTQQLARSAVPGAPLDGGGM